MALTDSITKFVHFSEHYPRNFIWVLWGSSPEYETIKGLFFRRSFCDFFMKLDSDNRQKLVEWIEENYKY